MTKSNSSVSWNKITLFTEKGYHCSEESRVLAGNLCGFHGASRILYQPGDMERPKEKNMGGDAESPMDASRGHRRCQDRAEHRETRSPETG